VATNYNLVLGLLGIQRIRYMLRNCLQRFMIRTLFARCRSFRLFASPILFWDILTMRTFMWTLIALCLLQGNCQHRVDVPMELFVSKENVILLQIAECAYEIIIVFGVSQKCFGIEKVHMFLRWVLLFMQVMICLME